jgi:phosphoglycolate phosphatase
VSHPLRVALFDLDGTISDSADGILHGIQHAFEVLGIRVDDDHDWRQYLGPPFRDALADIHGLPEPVVERGVDAYLDYYRNGGLYEAEVFPGIPALLEELHGRGVVLGVATSKRAFMAKELLENFGLRDRFAVVEGAFPDGTNGRKHEVIKRALDTIGVVDHHHGVVMIGDREHDIHGARVIGLPTIGVGWGYAAEGELAAAGADHLVATVDELAELLRTWPG